MQQRAGTRGFDRTTWAVSLLAVGLVIAWLAFSGSLLLAALPSEDEKALRALLTRIWASHVVLVVVCGIACLIGVVFVVRYVRLRHLTAISRLVEQLAMAVRAERLVTLPVEGVGLQKALARTANVLLRERDTLRHQVQTVIEESTAQLATERNQLATLMAELKQSIVVCNAHGQVLLFNARARELLSGSELPLQVGRLVIQWVDLDLMRHAQGILSAQVARLAGQTATEFVWLTDRGTMLRVHMTAITTRDTAAAPTPTVTGYVLLINDVSAEQALQSQREAWLYELTDFSRARLSSIRSAIDALEHPDISEAARKPLRAQIQADVGLFSEQLRKAGARAVADLIRPWPLQQMTAGDFLSVTARQIQSWLHVRVIVETTEEDLVLEVDSYSLMQALAHLSVCLVGAFALRYLTLRIASVDGQANLDLVWVGHVMSTETAMSWELDPMVVESGHVAMSVRDVVTRHKAQLLFGRALTRDESFFRWQLPLPSPTQPSTVTAPTAPTASPTPSFHMAARPEFFDFDLFRTTPATGVLADQSLASLTYTVFDTETTGLNPSQGDEIIQIGAVRIVGNKLRMSEVMDQLVNPIRSIPKAGIAIHGITPDDVRDAPEIGPVLHQFKIFAADSVLVAHNAAFDMRFLELKEVSTGTRFDQPVLDTLLLAAVAFPAQTTHGLMALAQQLGVPVAKRHHALSDAIMTAEIFLRLMPILADNGITTLQQALDASKKTYYARVAY